jgi:hypothetical protein
MDLENEIKELRERGLLRFLSDLLKKGDFNGFNLYLSYAEAMRNTQYAEVRAYAESYAVIRGA